MLLAGAAIVHRLNLVLSENFRPKCKIFGWKLPFWGKVRGQIEIPSTDDLLCVKFADVCRRIATSCPAFLNPRRHWIWIGRVRTLARLAVRPADCCMQLVVDLLWTCCATSCSTCCKTCCLFYNLLWTFVVDSLLAFDPLWICRTTCCTTYPQQIEANGVRH